jgi:hypothetical protein
MVNGNGGEFKLVLRQLPNLKGPAAHIRTADNVSIPFRQQLKAASVLLGHVQRRGAVPVTVRAHDDFNVLIEFHQEPQQPFNRELPELAAQHLRDIGLADAEQRGGLGLFHAALFHDGVDLEDQLRLDQMIFRIRYADILEDIPAPDLIPFDAHGFSPIAMRSASRSRCLINSMPRA